MARLSWLLLALLALPAGAPGQSRLAQQPTHTPYTQGPELLNRGRVGALLAERYPSRLRDRGVEGTAVLWLFVDEDGRVANRQVERSSGYVAMDAVAMDVAQAMRFTPARNRDRVVPVWITRAVAFRLENGQPVPLVDAPKETGVPVPGGDVGPDTGGARESAALTRDRPLAAEPTYTPYTSRPELLNAEEVVAALVGRYPPILESAGVEGTVAVWLFIDEEGRVLRRVIDVSSGYPAMDSAAVEVAATMRFRPARLNGVATPVWISVPIRFRAN